MFFANEQRENVREENPGITFGKSHTISRYAITADAASVTQAKLAKSSVNAGRLSMRSSVSLMKPKPKPTRLAMRVRRPATL